MSIAEFSHSNASRTKNILFGNFGASCLKTGKATIPETTIKVYSVPMIIVLKFLMIIQLEQMLLNGSHCVYRRLFV